MDKIVVAPGFADPGVLGKMFRAEFGDENIRSIPVPGHPKTSPNNPKYWVRAIGDEANKVLTESKPELVVTNSIHTIETLSQIKALEGTGDLHNTKIAAFSPAFDIPQAVTNMYNLMCNNNTDRKREDILGGDIELYQKLMQLVKGGIGDPEEFRNDLNYYNDYPELFFELIEYFGDRIKILLNPNDKIIFSVNNGELSAAIKRLNFIAIEGRDNGKNGKTADFMSHIQAKRTAEKLPELSNWIS